MSSLASETAELLCEVYVIGGEMETAHIILKLVIPSDRAGPAQRETKRERNPEDVSGYRACSGSFLVNAFPWQQEFAAPIFRQILPSRVRFPISAIFFSRRQLLICFSR